MWHLDGNHKLIRWKFVIHGAIDGYSRLVTFLKCSTNNRSETVLQCFVEATEEYEIPSRVRTDHGGENVKVWEYMEEQRGFGRNSYLAGQSVHNTRIERLWRDVYRLVSSSYSAAFTELESAGALNVDNGADLYALHHVYVPKINASLDAFRSSWNNHSLSTESNMSPLQLYMAYAQGSDLFDETVDPQTFGIDPSDAQNNDAEDTERVVVPQVEIPLSPYILQRLHAEIDVLQQCDDFGKQLYIDTVHLLYDLMIQDDDRQCFADHHALSLTLHA